MNVRRGGRQVGVSQRLPDEVNGGAGVERVAGMRVTEPVWRYAYDAGSLTSGSYYPQYL